MGSAWWDGTDGRGEVEVAMAVRYTARHRGLDRAVHVDVEVAAGDRTEVVRSSAGGRDPRDRKGAGTLFLVDPEDALSVFTACVGGRLHDDGARRGRRTGGRVGGFASLFTELPVAVPTTLTDPLRFGPLSTLLASGGLFLTAVVLGPRAQPTPPALLVVGPVATVGVRVVDPLVHPVGLGPGAWIGDLVTDLDTT